MNGKNPQGKLTEAVNRLLFMKEEKGGQGTEKDCAGNQKFKNC